MKLSALIGTHLSDLNCNAGPRMTSIELVSAAAARRPIAREGRILSLDRPQRLGGHGAASIAPLRTNSAAEMSLARLAGPDGQLAALTEAAKGDGVSQVGAPIRQPQC